MTQDDLPHTFSLYGVVVSIASTTDDNKGIAVTVAIGEDRAFVTIPPSAWPEGAGVFIGGRVHVQGKTDFGPIKPHSRNVATSLKIVRNPFNVH